MKIVRTIYAGTDGDRSEGWFAVEDGNLLCGIAADMFSVVGSDATLRHPMTGQRWAGPVDEEFLDDLVSANVYRSFIGAETEEVDELPGEPAFTIQPGSAPSQAVDEVGRRRWERLEQEFERMQPMLKTLPAIERRRALADEIREALRDSTLDDVTAARIENLLELLAAECGF